MTLRLDPRIPLLWRTPRSVQFGVDAPVAIVDDLGSVEETLLAALTIGVSESGLALLARQLGSTDEVAATLAESVRPALARPGRSQARRVLVHGSSRAADRIAETLEGVTVLRSRDAASAASIDCDLAIVVVDWVVPPELVGLWLRRDIAHLPVIVSDASVTVGPFVAPGGGPCLYCRHRTLTDEDAAWPSIAIQLSERAAPHPGLAVVAEAAALVSRFVASRSTAPHSVTLDALTGSRSERVWRRHPSCACDDALTAPAGNGSAVVSTLALPRRRTTTAAPIGALA